MRHLPRPSILALTSVLIAGLAACGGSDETDAASETTAAAEPAAEPVDDSAHYLDYSHEQTAAVLGCRRGTVKSLIHRALGKMRVMVPK